MAGNTPNTTARLFRWRQLLLFLFVATAIGSVAAYFAYNGPLTSTAWHDWINLKCGNPPKSSNGALFGPIKDIARIGLALLLVIIGFATLRIIPKIGADGTRALNWRPFSKPTTDFERRFIYERWFILGGAVLGCLAVAVFRPLDFWGQSEIAKPATLGYFDLIRELYGTVFREITQPYLFPYSLYIFALWLAIALPLLLAFFRSVLYDPIEYRELLRRLDVSQGVQPVNAVATYERRTQDAFAFIDGTARNYALFLVGVLAIAYIQEDFLGCSVLEGAANAGKMFLLLFSISAFAGVLIWYLRYYAQTRAAALAGIAAISDVLERDQNRDDDLHDANELAENVRKRDGFKLLTAMFTGGGVVAIVFGVLWKVVGQNLCWAAKGVFPTWMVDWVANLLQTKC